MSKKISYCLFLLLLITARSFGKLMPIQIETYDAKPALNEVEHLYRHVLTPTLPVSKRIETASAFFLGRKYLLGALGEGAHAEFDHRPLFRTDAFDCVTFTNTVMALAQSSNSTAFYNHFKHLQYKNAEVSYYTRRHFTEVDWNLVNEKKGLLQDITRSIYGPSKIATAVIDKPEWYRHLTVECLKVFTPLTDNAVTRLMTTLHRHALSEEIRVARTAYIPLAALIEHKEIFETIPSGAIIQIVDKTQGFKAKIGTDLNIAHLGFAIKTSHGLIFRHASRIHKRIEDVPLAQYLRWYCSGGKSPELVGIHIEKVCL